MLTLRNRPMLLMHVLRPNFAGFWLRIAYMLLPVADLGEGMGGCIPPTSLKVTISAEKSASIWNNSAPFGDASPPPASS